MENPDFIQKLLNHYTEELMPVPGTEIRFVGIKGEKLKFRDRRDVTFHVPIALLDLAKSRHDAGKKTLALWVHRNGSTNHATPGLIKALLAQFP